MDRDFFKLFDEIKPPYPKGFRLFLVNDTGYFYINKERKVASSHSDIFGMFSFTSLDRGKILDIFTKLDFLIGELIRLKLVGFEFESNERLVDLISRFTLQARISVLNDWGIINNSLKNELKSLIQVRNGLAHKFHAEEVIYNNQSINEREALRKLASDFSNIWKKIVLIYSNEQKKIDLQDLKIKLTNWQSNQIK